MASESKNPAAGCELPTRKTCGRAAGLDYKASVLLILCIDNNGIFLERTRLEPCRVLSFINLFIRKMWIVELQCGDWEHWYLLGHQCGPAELLRRGVQVVGNWVGAERAIVGKAW